MKTIIKKEENYNLNYESLIQRLKLQDAEIGKKNKLTIILSIIVLLASGLECILNRDYDFVTNDHIFNILVFIVLSYIVSYRILFFIKFKRVNYADSVKNSLKSAEKRYRFWNTKMIYEITAAIVVGLILGYFFYIKHVDNWAVIGNIVVTSFIPLFLGAFSMGVRYIRWKNNKKLMWISVKNLIKEFEE